MKLQLAENVYRNIYNMLHKFVKIANNLVEISKMHILSNAIFVAERIFVAGIRAFDVWFSLGKIILWFFTYIYCDVNFFGWTICHFGGWIVRHILVSLRPEAGELFFHSHCDVKNMDSSFLNFYRLSENSKLIFWILNKVESHWFLPTRDVSMKS